MSARLRATAVSYTVYCQHKHTLSSQSRLSKLEVLYVTIALALLYKADRLDLSRASRAWRLNLRQVLPHRIEKKLVTS